MLIERLAVLGVFRAVACHQIGVELYEAGTGFSDVRINPTDFTPRGKGKGSLVDERRIPLLEKHALLLDRLTQRRHEPTGGGRFLQGAEFRENASDIRFIRSACRRIKTK